MACVGTTQRFPVITASSAYNGDMADSKGLSSVTLLLPNDLYTALQAKLAREQKDFSPVAVALLQQYLDDGGNPEFERRLAHVDDIMRPYDSTLRALAK